MTQQLSNDVSDGFRVMYGEKGKKYFVVSRSFWDNFQEKLKKTKNRREVSHALVEASKGKLDVRSLDGWIYGNQKPFIVDSFEVGLSSGEGCRHGSRYFCPLCKLNKNSVEKCPVPLFWVTDRKGKLYLYLDYWKELKHFVDNGLKYGFLPQHLYKFIDIDDREVRSWKSGKCTPKTFVDDEFVFSGHNSYFLGIYLSDGHLRNNGSNLSFTYQVGSSNLFQGYWYPQFIQRFLPIFKNKKDVSSTFLRKIGVGSALFTNLSSFSPIFVMKMAEAGLIEKKYASKTSGWKKRIPKQFLKDLLHREEYFQGIFDGDGHYSWARSPMISLATDPKVDYSHLVEYFSLVPTAVKESKTTTNFYEKIKTNLYDIRFAPTSLKRMSQNYSAQDVVTQLNFFLCSARNSIRPDKVHQLVGIVKRITSGGYGEYRNCLPIQQEIRELAIKAGLKAKSETLERQYPVKEGKYLPFMPRWAENLCSKQEAWEFFFRKENLSFRNEKIGKALDFDFSEGIPVNLTIS